MEIYNDAGVLLASAEMLSHFCRKSGVGTTVANTAGGDAASMIQIGIPAGFDKPIIAISCGNAVAYSGLFSGNAYFWCSGAVGTGYTYYIFDTPEDLATAHSGLELYDTAGNIVFSSNYYPMKILGLNPGVTNYPGKTVAAALPAWANSELNSGLQCWDTSVAVPWSNPTDSGPCADLQYHHTVNARGAFIDNGGSRFNPATIQYEDVQILAGNDSSYTEPPSAISRGAIAFAVDVTNIPIGSTFF